MADKKIELSQEELEDIKDEVKFRTKVLLSLKRLNGIPERVNRLEVWQKVYGFILVALTIGLFWKVLEGIDTIMRHK